MAAAGSLTQILPVQSFMAGGCLVRVYEMTFLSSSGGAVQEIPIALVVGGELRQFEVLPNTDTTQPTDQFDLTLLSDGTLDLLAGEGANLSNAAPKMALMDPPVLLQGNRAIYPTISNAGNAKGGTIRFYVA